MKVNCISSTNIKHVQTDMESIRVLFKKCKDSIEFQSVNGYHFKCSPASINLFINMVNPCFYTQAKVNLILLDPSEFTTNKMYALKDMDGILVKTKYAYDVVYSECIRLGIFTKDELAHRLHLIGWRSPDLSIHSSKDINKVLLFCDTKETPVYMDIVRRWKSTYPTLCVVNGNGNRECNNRNKTETYEGVEFYDDISNDAFHKLFNSCAFHICVDNGSAFDHMAHQCKLVGSVPIGCKSGGRAELLTKDCAFILSGKRKKNTGNTLGGSFTTNLTTLEEVMEEIVNTSEGSLKSMMKEARVDAMRFQKKSDDCFVQKMKEYIFTARNRKKILRDKLSVEELPSISIVTTTYNRKKIFPLAIYNYNSFSYPRDKLEWIIVDDSVEEQRISSLLPPEDSRAKYNIKYVMLDDKKSIAEKRNIGVQMAKNDFVLLMDDDDYFYPDTLTTRINEYMNVKRDLPYKKMMGFTKLGCFDVERYVSWIDVTKGAELLPNAIAGSSLIFERDFYTENNQFNNESKKNGFDTFLKGNEHVFMEQSWEKQFVVLSHKNCIMGKHAPQKQDSNGCHFGFSKKLFDFIIELFKEPVKELPPPVLPKQKVEEDYEVISTPEPSEG